MSELQATTNASHIYDVIIVGAGPIGLATAVGLHQRGIDNILVIDQARAFRRVGQVLDLLPNGLKALKCISLQAYTAVQETSLQFFNPQQLANKQASPKWVYKNLHGETIRSTPLHYEYWLDQFGAARYPIPWFNLQTTLRNLLPPAQVRANHRCINVVDEPNLGCVRIDCLSNTNIELNLYAHWQESPNHDTSSANLDDSTSITSFRAKLIIAADGIKSTVRQAIYQNSPDQNLIKPEYSGFASILCRKTSELSPQIKAELVDKFLQDAMILTILDHQISTEQQFIADPYLHIIPAPDGQFSYMLNIAIPLQFLEEKTGNELINLALQKLEKNNFPEVVKQLILASIPENMQQRPYYIHDATTTLPWHQGRVVLIGDAAHGMPPFMAQGANQGLEDALAIVNAVTYVDQHEKWDDGQFIEQVFQKYENLRRPWMVYIQNATLKRYTYISDSASKDYNKKVYIRDFEHIYSYSAQ